MSKIVITICGKADTGKSTAVMKAAQSLINYKNVGVPKLNYSRTKNDVSAIIPICQYLIGVESQGDPNSNLYERLAVLVEKECNIIICSSRSYGNTVEAVQTACSEYKQIWLRTSDTIDSQKNCDLILEIIDRFFPNIEKN